MRRTLTPALIALGVAFAAASVASARVPVPPDASAKPSERCRAGYRPLASPRVARAAVVRSRASVHRLPGAPAFASFGRVNANRFPTVLGVRGEVVSRRCAALWYRVQVPLRPNGRTGWVRARDVDLVTVRTRIVVDLSDRRVTLYVRGRRVFSARAAVGAPATPTPTGRFYVDQRLVPADPGGPFGPGALGISAFSTVLTGWTQGGPVAIHGTNAPWLIGGAVSNGCIRLRNDDLRRLFAVAAAGTPVVIRR